jgi:hypothetical protein
MGSWPRESQAVFADGQTQVITFKQKEGKRGGQQSRHKDKGGGEEEEGRRLGTQEGLGCSCHLLWAVCDSSSGLCVASVYLIDLLHVDGGSWGVGKKSSNYFTMSSCGGVLASLSLEQLEFGPGLCK